MTTSNRNEIIIVLTLQLKKKMKGLSSISFPCDQIIGCVYHQWLCHPIKSFNCKLIGQLRAWLIPKVMY